jgi:hypothetical protein
MTDAELRAWGRSLLSDTEERIMFSRAAIFGNRSGSWACVPTGIRHSEYKAMVEARKRQIDLDRKAHGVPSLAEAFDILRREGVL